MSDNDENDSENQSDEEENFYLVNKNFAIILIDGTTQMINGKNILHESLKIIHNSLATWSEAIKSHSKTRSKYGVVIMQDEPEFIVKPGEYNFERIKYEIEKSRNSVSGCETLPLAKSLEFAISAFSSPDLKSFNKIITLITNNPEPTLDDNEQFYNSARLINASSIEFVLVPIAQQTFLSSKIYNNFFDFLNPSKCQTCQIDSPKDLVCMFKEILFVKPASKKLTLFYQSDRGFEVQSDKLFRTVYSSYQRVKFNPETKNYEPVERKMKYTPIDDHYNDENQMKAATDLLLLKNQIEKSCRIPDLRSETSIKYTTFSNDQIKYIQNRNMVSIDSGIDLLWVGEEKNVLMNENIPARLIRADSLSRNQIFFTYFWKFCMENNKVLYCMYRNKKMMHVILKPTVFKDETCFVMYTVGYLDNFQPVKIDENIYKVSEIPQMNQLIDIQKQILRKLVTPYTCVDILDPKVAFEQELAEAQVSEKPFDLDNVEDQASVQYHHVKEKVDDLVDEFNKVIDEISCNDIKRKPSSAKTNQKKKVKK